MKRKKVLFTCIVIGIVAVAALVFGWKYYQDSTNIVTVVPVELIRSDWGMNQQQSSGIVTNSLSQNVVATGERDVKEVYVKTGQKVKIGEKILSYNMEEEKLDLELKGYDVQELEFSIKRAEKDLTNLKNGIVTDDYDSYGTVGRKNPLLASLFFWNKDMSLPNVASQDKTEVDVEDENYENGSEDGLEDDSEDGTEEEYEEDYDTYEPSYSYEELRQMITAKENEISDLKLQLKEEKLAYDTMKKEVEDGTVTAAVEGFVKEVNNTQAALEGGNPIVVIVSEDALYVKGTVDEFNYENIKADMLISATSWDTGKVFQARILSISNYPVSDSSDGVSSTGNPNVSYYPYSAIIEDDIDDIKSGETVTITFAQSTATSESDSLYIPLAYVKTEGNTSYVYIADEKNRLKKQTVVTGQTLYNTVIEVKDGLDGEDYIAFPYGKKVREGAKTEISQDEEDIVY